MERQCLESAEHVLPVLFIPVGIDEHENTHNARGPDLYRERLESRLGLADCPSTTILQSSGWRSVTSDRSQIKQPQVLGLVCSVQGAFPRNTRTSRTLMRER
jgi:hypothetical protein